MQLQAKIKTGSAIAIPKPSRSGQLLQRQCACGQHTGGASSCPACESRSRATLQRSATGLEGMNELATQQVAPVLNSAGQPLEAATRSTMEGRFGYDFSGVRVHTDSQAAESARSLDALAYTVGQNVVFARGQYAPGEARGQRLLAHELAHVVQQGGSAGARNAGLARQSLSVGVANSPAEQQADQAAETVMAGANPVLSNLASAGEALLQREPDPNGGSNDQSAARQNLLAELANNIREKDDQIIDLREKLAAQPQISSAPANEARTNLQNSITRTEAELKGLLERRIKLLDEEIGRLKGQLPPNYTPAVQNNTMTELAKRESERRDEAQRLLSIQRGESRRELATVEARLVNLPKTSSPERESLEARKKELGKMLSSTSPKRTPAGTAGTDSHKQPYVVYQDEVKVGGKLPWINNNPGNVTGPRSLEGVIGFNPAGIGFVIFKDREFGIKASSRWWENRRAKSPSDTIENSILIYSQGMKREPQNLADAKTYNDHVESWTGIKRTTTLGTLNDEQLRAIVMAVLRQEGGLSEANAGQTYSCADSSAPGEYRRLLGCDE